MIVMNKKQDKPIFQYEEEEVFHVFNVEKEPTLNLIDLQNSIENYGEWKELIGYFKGKNLNPKLVKKYIEAILEIEKLVE
jgi:hypothetical protein